MKENNIKERLVEALKGKIQGMTIQELSNLLCVSRNTVSKYIYGLISEDVVYQRKIGPAKLCCLVIK